jgi:hypothetical protein
MIPTDCLAPCPTLPMGKFGVWWHLPLIHYQ